MANAKQTSKNKARSWQPARHARLEAWANQALKALLLSDEWTITVSAQDSEDDVHAKIEMSESNEALLVVSAAFWFESPDRQLKIMAHELCHLYLVPVCHFHDAISITEEQRKLYDALIKEPITERISRVLWRLLPKMPKL